MVLLRTDVHCVGDLPPQQPREIQRMLAERLEAKDREEFFALPNCKGSRPEISGIIDTNILGVTWAGSDRRVCGVVCKTVSRAGNRNAMYSVLWNKTNERLSPIAVGIMLPGHS